MKNRNFLSIKKYFYFKFSSKLFHCRFPSYIFEVCYKQNIDKFEKNRKNLPFSH